MRATRSKNPLILTLLAFGLGLWLTGCDNGTFKDSGNSEKKKVADASIPGVNSLDGGEEDTPIANAFYQIKVNANTGMELCSGRIQVLLSTSFDLNPTGTMKCLILGDMDMEKLFGGKVKVAAQDVDMKQFPGFGKISRGQNPVSLAPGNAIANPPFPSVIGPLIQNPQDYAGFVFKEPSQVQGISKAGEQYQTQGEWFIQVHSVNQTHRPPSYQGSQQFNKVIKWEKKAAGFENSPKTEFMAFESMTFFWNTDPIAVPELQIKAKLADLPNPDGSTGGGLGGIGDLIFSGITISITLIDQQPL